MADGRGRGPRGSWSSDWVVLGDEDYEAYERRRAGRLRRALNRLGWGRSRGGSARRRWYWPGPFGGVGATLLIATVVLAIPVAVVLRPAQGKLPSAGAPRAPAAAQPGSPGPLFSAGANGPGEPSSTASPGFPFPELSSGAGPNPSATGGATYSGGPSSPGGQGRAAPAPGAPNTSYPDLGFPPLPLPKPYPASVAGTFVAVTGGGCPAANNASYFAAYLAGWPVENLSGGWTGRGCTDRFWAVPMSGSANSDPGDTYVLWFFVTAPVTSGRCDIWAYIPKTGRDRDVAGNPTTYEVLRSKEDQKVIGTFSIKQPEHRGTWVHGGTFGFDGGKIAVKLRNRGAGTGDARHAAAQVLVHCKPR